MGGIATARQTLISPSFRTIAQRAATGCNRGALREWAWPVEEEEEEGEREREREQTFWLKSPATLGPLRGGVAGRRPVFPLGCGPGGEQVDIARSEVGPLPENLDSWDRKFSRNLETVISYGALSSGFQGQS